MRIRAQRLPIGYRELEYIESTGTQYVDTGYIPTANYKYSISFRLLSFTKPDIVLSFLFASYKSGNRYCLQARNNEFYFQTGAGENVVVTAELGKDYYFEATPSIYKLNDTSYSTGSSFVSGGNGYSFQLFYDSRYGNDSQAIMRVYSSKIWDSNIIIRNFIPAERCSDNKPGLYDTVNNVFYVNQGTGEFIKGPYNDWYKISVKNNDEVVSYNVVERMYGYNQLLNYDYAAPSVISPENGTVSKSGKNITFTKNENTNYYALTLYTTYNDNKSKYGDKIYIKIKFSSISAGLIGKTASFGCAEVGPSGWLHNPGKSITFTSGKYVYEVIDNVKEVNTTSVQAKILHTTGTTLYGELFTVESCEVINLTTWYGTGKEPTTVTAFKEKFPNDYYGYFPDMHMLTQKQINDLPLYGYNQRIVNGNFINGTSGWSGHGSATISALNGVVTVVPPSTGLTNFGLSRGLVANMTVGHKLMVVYTSRITSGSATIRLRFPALYNSHTLTSNFNTFYDFATVADSAPGSFLLQCQNGSGNVSVDIKNVWLVDLTDWYGPGDEPTTEAEFKMTFPKKFYPEQTKANSLNRYQINALGINY